MITIFGTPHAIVIAENTFQSNSAVKGLVYIDSPHRSQPLFIYKNIFTNNIAYFGTVGIFIRARTETVSSITTIDPTSESDL